MNHPKVYAISLYIFVENVCTHKLTTHGWNSLRHLLTLSGSKAAWRTQLAVALSAQCPGQLVTPVTIKDFFLYHTAFKWLLKAIVPSRIHCY